MQDKYFKSGLACFLEEDDSSWDSSDDENMIDPCWELKSQLYLFVKKVGEPWCHFTSEHRRSEEKEYFRLWSLKSSFCKGESWNPECLSDCLQIYGTRKMWDPPHSGSWLKPALEFIPLFQKASSPSLNILSYLVEMRHRQNNMSKVTH